MITIDQVRAWIRGESKEILFDFALRAADLAISQHEEIERLRTALSEAAIAERKACWEAINKHIASGPLVGGNGTDPNAQRNGMVLACNIIHNMSGEPK